MPVGGLGTGFVCLSGRGALTEWQLMNRPHRGWRPTYAHLLLRTDDGARRRLRVLEGDLVEGKAADWGHAESLAGIPRFPECAFESTFPLGRAVLREEGFLDVEIDAFSPFVPGDVAASTYPCALMAVTVRNLEAEAKDATLAFALTNFVGSDGVETDLTDNVTEFADAHGWNGLLFRKARDERSPRMGEIVVLADSPAVEVARRWAFRDGPWGGERLGIIDALLERGSIPDEDPGAPCPPSGPDGWDSSLCARFTVPASGEATVRLLVAWRFPWIDARECGWSWTSSVEPLIESGTGVRFACALDAAKELIPDLEALRSKTEAFAESVVKRDAPDVLKEAALFNLAHLRSHTLLQLGTGEWMGFEGCNGTTGCCMGSCSHVWNYEAATVRLFPEIHRSMVDTHLRHGATAQGAGRFRLTLPLVGDQQNWNGAAADGQMGLIVRVWEQYQVDRDADWLARVYPLARRLLAFAWAPGGWDADRDGVMEGAQHNTYDVEFFGPNPLGTVWYLAALRAVAAMARELGDDPGDLEALAARGGAWVDEHLYNGAYYEQRVMPPPQAPADLTVHAADPAVEDQPFQVGAGCLIDQLVGQVKAARAGLGPLLDPAHLRTAAGSIFARNHREGFRDHYNNMRSYALDDEHGTIICDYPPGTRPPQPLSYWGECMTGFEYALAVLLLDCGHREEALKVAAAVRGRHSGHNRNPFNEPECGSYYARSMASWALLDAWDSAGRLVE